MEHYYYLAILGCLLLIAAGFYWITKDKKLNQKQLLLFSKPKAENYMVREYAYDSCSNPRNPLLSRLKDVPLYNPQTRPTSNMDIWFKMSTARLAHNGACLAYIEHYGHLEDAFWKNAAELGIKLEEDEKFQYILASVCKTSLGNYCQNFSNMLFHFGCHHKLLPKIENIIFNDLRFIEVKQTYELAQDCSKKRKT